MAEWICTKCNVALYEPHQDIQMAAKGWVKCRLCAHCIIIESEIIFNRIKNQK